MAPTSLKRPTLCTHIKAAGQRCGSPALRGEFFCYFHTRIIKGVQQRVDMRLDSMALLEDCESIQLSLMNVVDGLVKGTLEPTRAKLIIQALRIAARNAKNVRFDDSLYQPTDPPMVRQVPDYARQYQIEHAELAQSNCGAGAPARESATTANPCGADTPVCEAKPTAHPCGADTPVRQAKPTTAAQRETQSEQPAAQQNVSMKSPKSATTEPAAKRKQNASQESATSEPAAKRRKNAAQSASCGSTAENDPPPKERKKPSHGPSDDENPLSASESKELERIQQAEAAIPGALEGNWRDLRTLFEFAGISAPSKEAPRSLESMILEGIHYVAR